MTRKQYMVLKSSRQLYPNDKITYHEQDEQMVIVRHDNIGPVQSVKVDADGNCTNHWYREVKHA